MKNMDRAASDQIEAAIRAQPFAFSPTPKPERIMSKNQIIKKMADALIERASVMGGATEHALLDAGFTRTEVEEHGEAAADKARSIQTT